MWAMGGINSPPPAATYCAPPAPPPPYSAPEPPKLWKSWPPAGGCPPAGAPVGAAGGCCWRWWWYPCAAAAACICSWAMFWDQKNCCIWAKKAGLCWLRICIWTWSCAQSAGCPPIPIWTPGITWNPSGAEPWGGVGRREGPAMRV